jgi:hypothetical protein
VDGLLKDWESELLKVRNVQLSILRKFSTASNIPDKIKKEDYNTALALYLTKLELCMLKSDQFRGLRSIVEVFETLAHDIESDIVSADSDIIAIVD